MPPPVKRSIPRCPQKPHTYLFRTVFACKWCLTCAQFSPDSDETTFSLKKAILWIEGLGGILGGINRLTLKCLNDVFVSYKYAAFHFAKH